MLKSKKAIYFQFCLLLLLGFSFGKFSSLSHANLFSEYSDKEVPDKSLEISQNNYSDLLHSDFLSSEGNTDSDEILDFSRYTFCSELCFFEKLVSPFRTFAFSDLKSKQNPRAPPSALLHT